ncbi:MAG: response regulator [Anaerolineaceae bacterium]|nr:response regulator [Anaerolineaceae bacterium]
MSKSKQYFGDVLIVDDRAPNLHILSSMLSENGYKVRPALNGELALKVAKKTIPDIILLDIQMPGMDGYQVCEALKADESTQDIPVIFISALDDVLDKVRAFEVGGLDYVTKPFQLEEVLSRVQTHLKIRKLQKDLEIANHEYKELNEVLEEKVKERTWDLEQAYRTTIEGWALALELRDYETKGHSQRVVKMTEDICKILGIEGEDLTVIRRGAILHDIGKMGIPDSILLKPGSLTEDEWNIMKRHPVYAREMLKPIDFLAASIDIPYYHHEKWDGSGYPEGLKGEEIPLMARIFSIVDVYDALVSDRPYRKALSNEIVLSIIKDDSGKHFDPKIVEVFLDILEKDA